ncbi:MAG: ATP-binding protein [Ignavibacteriota bacterium]
MTKQDWDSREIQNSSFFVQLYEKSLDAIVIIDNNNEIIHTNKAFTNLFQFELHEVKGKNLNKFIVPADLISESEEMTQLAAHSEIVRKDTRRKCRDGKEIWVSIMGLPITFDNNKTGVVAVYNDVSKLVEVRERSEEASRMKTALLANMSHEFRTPMSAILGFSDILREELSNSDHLSMIKDIHSSAKRLLNTLNSILELSHLESADFKPNPACINVSSVIASQSETFHKLSNFKNLSYTLDIDSKECFCYLDEEILKQIVTNVFDNAVKYTHKGGIGVKVCTQDNYCVISITDTGIGISKDNQKVIFNEFRQVSEGISRTYEGAGLGLTLSKRMIDLMDGKVEVDSDIGRGATFKVSFPLVDKLLLEKTLVEKNRFVTTYTAAEDSKPAFLLVEDNKTNKVLIKRFLLNNYNIDDVSSGRAALEIIGKKKYRLIMMDINLGLGMNGIETANEIKKVKGYGNVPIVAVTGYALAGDKEKILMNGFDGYISKPFTREALVETLTNALVNAVQD